MAHLAHHAGRVQTANGLAWRSGVPRNAGSFRKAVATAFCSWRLAAVASLLERRQGKSRRPGALHHSRHAALLGLLFGIFSSNLLYAEVLRNDAVRAAGAAERAYLDTFGIAPDAQGAPTGGVPGDPLLYHQLLAEYLVWLASNPTAYKAVIHRAYRWTIHREAYPEELVYWKEHGTLSYSLLVGCLEDWARRNQPGLMVTGGTPTISVNCPYLETFRVSPDLAAILRAAVDLAPTDGRDHHIIAPGAETVVSSGGIHFVAAGSPALREASRRDTVW